MTTNPICVALDTPDLARAVALVDMLKGHVGMVKLGMEFFYAHGKAGYETVAALDVPVFLDLKLHDIPNTVAHGLTSLMALQPRPAVTNIHVGAGPATMRAAVDAMAQLAGERPKLIGLTVLTSLDEDDLMAIGYNPLIASAAHTVRQAQLAQHCGLDGVVCSSLDVNGIKAACGDDFICIVPGIRPANAAIQDQKRIATPKQALTFGADILVIGRPITQANDPVAAADAILTSLA